MAVSYKRLWKLLVDKEMSKSDLRKSLDEVLAKLKELGLSLNDSEE